MAFNISGPFTNIGTLGFLKEIPDADDVTDIGRSNKRYRRTYTEELKGTTLLGPTQTIPIDDITTNDPSGPYVLVEANPVRIGAGSTNPQLGSIAIGSIASVVDGNNHIAIGNGATVGASGENNSVVIGTGAFCDTSAGVAIGNGAILTVADAVTLGSATCGSWFSTNPTAPNVGCDLGNNVYRFKRAFIADTVELQDHVITSAPAAGSHQIGFDQTGAFTVYNSSGPTVTDKVILDSGGTFLGDVVFNDPSLPGISGPAYIHYKNNPIIIGPLTGLQTFADAGRLHTIGPGGPPEDVAYLSDLPPVVPRPQILYVARPPIGSVTNSTAELNFLTLPPTIPAGTFNSGSDLSLRIKARYNIVSSDLATTCTFRLRLGGAVAWTYALSTNALANTRGSIDWDAVIVTDTSIAFSGDILLSQIILSCVYNLMAGIDPDIGNHLNISAQWSTASATNIVDLEAFNVEILSNP